jgi:hypothetical protein
MAERELWGAVLLAAVNDTQAEKPVLRQCPEGKDLVQWRRAYLARVRNWRLNRMRAVEYFTIPSPDFREVCQNAGLDPDFIRDAFLDGRLNISGHQASHEVFKNGHHKKAGA